LLDIRKSLETPVSFRGQTWSIPVDTEMGCNFGKYDPEKNYRGLAKLKFPVDMKPEDLAILLMQTYEKFRIPKE
jgi:hypothetical protein